MRDAVTGKVTYEEWDKNGKTIKSSRANVITLFVENPLPCPAPVLNE